MAPVPITAIALCEGTRALRGTKHSEEQKVVIAFRAADVYDLANPPCCGFAALPAFKSCLAFLSHVPLFFFLFFFVSVT